MAIRRPRLNSIGLILAFLFLPCLARAQGVSITGSVTVNTTVGNVPGFTSALQAVSNATVTVCSSSGGGLPCTPAVTIYSNSTLTTIATNPLATCVGAATQGCIDGNGNYQFWVPPNNSGYLVSQTGPSIVGRLGAVSAPVTESATETLSNKTLTSPGITNPTTTGTDTGTETLSNKTLASPISTGTDSGTETLTNKALTSPVINGTPSGTGVPTITLKKGSAAGNYTSASTSYVDVDATNLAYTVTIPLGWKLAVQASAPVGQLTAAGGLGISLFDSATIVEQVLVPATFGTTAQLSVSLSWVINGDGNSHTVKLQYKTSNASDSVLISNSSATLLPTMVFTLTPSN